MEEGGSNIVLTLNKHRNFTFLKVQLTVVYKVPYSPPPKGGIYQIVGEEYQVVERRMEYYGLWE